MLNKEQSVKVSDTTEDESSNEAGTKKSLSTPFLFFLLLAQKKLRIKTKPIHLL